MSENIPADVMEKARAIAGGIVNPNSVMRYTSEADAAWLIARALLEARAEAERQMREAAAREAAAYGRNVLPARMFADRIAGCIRALPTTAEPAKGA